MKASTFFFVGTLTFSVLLQSAWADGIRYEISEQDSEETLPEIGETLLISFPNLGGDDLLTMEFVVTQEMLDSAWSLNDVFVAAKLEARSGHLPVTSGNKPLEAVERTPKQEAPAGEESDCD